MRKWLASLWLILLLPLILSLNPVVYDAGYLAQYQSPEGIRFLSYSRAWDEKQLRALYQELLRNKHGKELAALREVQVYGEEHARMNGEYHPATRVITLYNGDRKRTTAAMRNTLSHEYGHHFAFYYFPQHVLPIQTEWKTLRGADDAYSLAFWKYWNGYHKWFAPEIFADDYMMLYGATQKLNGHDEDVFAKMTTPENEDLPNVLENQKLQHYLEQGSGLHVDQDRVLSTPKWTKLSAHALTVNIMQRPDILYRFSFDYYEGKQQTVTAWTHRGTLTVSSAGQNGTVSLPFEKTLLPEQKGFDGSVCVTVEAVDLHTGLGLKRVLARFEMRDGAATQ
ncbi:hypothetical protein [Ectobacillus ponti]|uniref:Uncharacterized protein n=1 Tax=Ectobacillus ponti TaxID=2961894 RepID=A0AA41XBN9_9BACI|nr:hypothetical protein [Ectobacillus ponti]MCP8970384.1 hypothetical protein [Ectobacillus ponti]